MISLLVIFTAWCAVTVMATGVPVAGFVVRNRQVPRRREQVGGDHVVQSQVGGAQYGGGRR